LAPTVANVSGEVPPVVEPSHHGTMLTWGPAPPPPTAAGAVVNATTDVPAVGNAADPSPVPANRTSPPADPAEADEKVSRRAFAGWVGSPTCTICDPVRFPNAWVNAPPVTP